jgi:hypothetical protein
MEDLKKINEELVVLRKREEDGFPNEPLQPSELRCLLSYTQILCAWMQQYEERLRNVEAYVEAMSSAQRLMAKLENRTTLIENVLATHLRPATETSPDNTSPPVPESAVVPESARRTAISPGTPADSPGSDRQSGE